MDGMDMMKVSVITVCYNSARTIETTIQSVLGQTYEDVEYVIVDGGSTDGTIDLIKKYETKLSAWISGPDCGLYDAMNKGIRMATGDIVGIINSDDWYEADVIRKVAACFKDNSIDVVHGNMTVVSEDGRCRAASAPGTDPADIFFRMAYYHPTVFVRADAYRKYGMFDLNYKIAADYQMMLRLYTAGAGFFYLNENIAYFRLGGISGEKTAWRAAMEERKVALTHLNGRVGVGKDHCLKQIEALYRSARLRAGGSYIERKMGKAYVKNILLEALRGKESVAIFGAGYWGVKYYDWFIRRGIRVAYFVDNAPSKQNKRLGAVQIKRPDALKADRGNILTVVVVDGARAEIERQLKSFGLVAARDYLFIGDLQTRLIQQYLKVRFRKGE